MTSVRVATSAGHRTNLRRSNSAASLFCPGDGGTSQVLKVIRCASLVPILRPNLQRSQ